MGMGTKIEWTSYRKPDGTVVPGATFNPWRGCTKVSAGCTNCYAETMSGRNPGTLGVWGRHGTRVIAAESYWRQPLRWNREAEQAGERRRVFCASLSDVFEGPETMPASEWPKVEAARARLFGLIWDTPWLDWLLLTKRPQHVQSLIPQEWRDRLPHNVWLGTSVEHQAAADERIPHLLNVPAAVRFLSCEPLLGPVDLSEWVTAGGEPLDWTPDGDAPPGDYNPLLRQWETRPNNGGLHWIIVGGESGPNARPMHPAWARSLRDQCQAAGVAFFFKQWGAWHPDCLCATPRPCADTPRPQPGGIGVMFRCGKHAGRLLDGVEHNEYPEYPER